MKKSLRKTIIAMSSILIITTFFSSMLLAAGTMGQGIREVKVSMTFDDVPLLQAFTMIEEETPFEFLMNKTIEERSDRFTLNVENKSVEFVLKKLSEGTGLSFRQIDATAILVKEQKSPLKRVESKAQVPEVNLKSQERPINGKVVDEEGKPLSGATIQVKGTAIGTIADAEGNYRLSIPDGSNVRLVISFIGFQTQEIQVNARTAIDVTMVVDTTSLNEVSVVSTGYYKIEQRLNPGNIAKVDGQTIEQQPISNPLQALQGRLTGVNITQASGVPGSAFQIQIRGLNSLRDGRPQIGGVSGNDPLYLINGIPYPAESVSFNSTALTGGINPLNFINPNDIESIEILKDADATAIYGSRGANGVVRITMKQGTAGNFQVTYSGSMGAGTLENKLNVLNTEQYLMMRREAFMNDAREPGINDFDVNGTWGEDRNTDWQEELLGGSSSVISHQLTFSGGAHNTSFLFGVNYRKETTLFSDDFSDRKLSGNMNLNFNSNDKKLNLNFTSNFSINNNDLFASLFPLTAVTLAPNAPALRDEDGNLNWENGTFENPLSGFLNQSDTRTINLVTNFGISYELLSGLKIKSSFGYTELQSDEIVTSPIASLNPFSDEDLRGSSSFGNSSINTWIVEPQIEYKRFFGTHEITLLGGTTFQETQIDRQLVEATGYDSDALILNPLAAAETEVTGIDFSEYRFNSLYARLNYMYNEKYIVNLTGRRDGSSRFGPGKQFANFGAVGLAWIFTQEEFISDNLGFLSYGKLRGSYGVTGSDQVGNYEFLELWNPTEEGYDGVQGLAPNNLFNEDFAWEETTKQEIGLEIGVFEDRINLSTSYFQNSSSNQLIGQPLPRTTGFSSVQTNFPAEIENRGWEIELNTVNLSKGDFRWSSSFNISILRNELVSFDNIENSSFASLYEVGQPLSVQFVFDYTGVDPETGIATFRNVDDIPFLSASLDRLPLENTQADYFGGFQNAFEYKGFALDFLFRFVKQRGRDYRAIFTVPGAFSNQPVFVLDRWRNPGDVTDVPRFTQSGTARSANNNVQTSTQAFADASFIRLQNVMLSYQLPFSIIQKYKIENLRIFVQGQNLLTFTGYRGWDPETQSLSLPPLRIITTGLTVTL